MLAIIPARGGSKGLPGKNIKPLCGKPLIVHTIEAAIAAKNIDRLILSTDDEKIAAVCREYDIEIPFMRPAELANDIASAVDVYRYTLDRLNTGAAEAYTEFVVLQPTSPLRTAGDIDAAVELYKAQQADSVISVCEAAHPPIWAKMIDEQGVLREYFQTSEGMKNRQEIPLAYMPNGAVFVLKLDLLALGSYYSDNTFPYLMPTNRSIDIDSPIDFEFAEFLMCKALSR
ncbi:MAG: acylneuraminate cytidylyltransferase family protein [Desulfuromonas sp.]|nr:MAG: acylneuraminate cytidylyltransferase family protein [Desulfuromonas sp.]